MIKKKFSGSTFRKWLVGSLILGGVMLFTSESKADPLSLTTGQYLELGNHDHVILGNNAAGQDQYSSFAIYTNFVDSAHRTQEVFRADFQNVYDLTSGKSLLLVTLHDVFQQKDSHGIFRDVQTLTNPPNLSAAQGISGITFSPLASTASVYAVSALQSNVPSSGQESTPTQVYGTTGNSMLDWHVINSPGISALGHGNQSNLVNPYVTNPAWNNSVQNHSPVLIGSTSDSTYLGAQFFIEDANAKNDMKNLDLTSIRFQIGTGPAIATPQVTASNPVDNPTPDVTPVPEPTSFALFSLGALGTAIGAVRRRRQAA